MSITCTDCGRSYSRARDLRAHITKSHTNPLVVDEVHKLEKGSALVWRGVEHEVTAPVQRDAGALIVRLGDNRRLHFPHGNVRVQMRSKGAGG